MGVFKRGGVYWYKFKFAGTLIRESARTGNLELARRAERERRRALELGVNHLEPVAKPVLFRSLQSSGLPAILTGQTAPEKINRLKVSHLLPRFGGLLVNDIRAVHVTAYQQFRQHEKASNRTINMEIGALRQILKSHGRWPHIQGQVKMLREKEDVGRALSADEMSRVHAAAAKSRSRSLPVALTLLENSGMRLKELRTMRWSQVDLIAREVLVGKAKTKGSEGRLIPLNEPAYAAISAWRSLFPEALPEHYIFPSERYGFDGNEGRKRGKAMAWNVDPSRPIGSWKTAWTTCRREAGVVCRTHDLRHTFISRMGEGRVPDATLMALTGQLSRKMLERYSHTRVQAKRDAVKVLEGAQKWPHAVN